uniref:HDC18148 n=1 Tax=Drosophila melanogaster TaxID=7227 RepID=Q6III7_DROME|nr:TPA_inf: HDC18148 [Drosophila melanogaster]
MPFIGKLLLLLLLLLLPLLLWNFFAPLRQAVRLKGHSSRENFPPKAGQDKAFGQVCGGSLINFNNI